MSRQILWKAEGYELLGDIRATRVDGNPLCSSSTAPTLVPPIWTRRDWRSQMGVTFAVVLEARIRSIKGTIAIWVFTAAIVGRALVDTPLVTA